MQAVPSLPAIHLPAKAPAQAAALGEHKPGKDCCHKVRGVRQRLHDVRPASRTRSPLVHGKVPWCGGAMPYPLFLVHPNLDAISDVKNPAQSSTPTFPRRARLTAEKWPERVLAGLRRLPRDRRCLLRRVEPAHRRARPPPLPVRPTLDQERPFIGPQVLAGIPRMGSVDTRNPAPRTIPRQLAGMSAG